MVYVKNYPGMLSIENGFARVSRRWNISNFFAKEFSVQIYVLWKKVCRELNYAARCDNYFKAKNHILTIIVFETTWTLLASIFRFTICEALKRYMYDVWTPTIDLPLSCVCLVCFHFFNIFIIFLFFSFFVVIS